MEGGGPPRLLRGKGRIWKLLIYPFEESSLGFAGVVVGRLVGDYERRFRFRLEGWERLTWSLECLLHGRDPRLLHPEGFSWGPAHDLDLKWRLEWKLQRKC